MKLKRGDRETYNRRVIIWFMVVGMNFEYFLNARDKIYKDRTKLKMTTI